MIDNCEGLPRLLISPQVKQFGNRRRLMGVNSSGVPSVISAPSSRNVNPRRPANVSCPKSFRSRSELECGGETTGFSGFARRLSNSHGRQRSWMLCQLIVKNCEPEGINPARSFAGAKALPCRVPSCVAVCKNNTFGVFQSTYLHIIYPLFWGSNLS